MTSEPNPLRDVQYKNSSNFMARVTLNARFSTNPYRWTYWLFDQFDVPPNAKVLELGTGPALLWRSNANRIPQGWEITVSDFSPGMLAEACQQLKRVRGNFRCEVVDAQSIPFEDATFDMVTANHMLYHVPDIAKALGEIKRVLKPGGKFYAATNGEGNMRELSELIANYIGEPGFKIHMLKFTLENGAATIKPFFPDVTLRRHEDAMEVTEVQPIVDYVLSSSRWRLERIADAPQDFAAYIQREMDKTGSIHMSKEMGVFVATKV